jgi:predicted nuclease of predicted toxin-antitoxin system
MKGYLFDENLPNRIPVLAVLPIRTVKDVGSSPSDTAVWEYARANELIIVSKDADFSARIVVQQPPPWVVHLRFGNLRLKEFQSVLARLWPQIETALKTNKLVHVYRDRVEGIGS